MKEIKKVVAALIFYDGKLFAAARNENDERYGKYEFPGGKIEPFESGEDALKRELKEELAMEVEVLDLFMHVSHEYPKFQLEMDVFLCTTKSAEFSLFVHKEAGFFTKEELLKLPFLGADVKVVERIKNHLPF